MLGDDKKVVADKEYPHSKALAADSEPIKLEVVKKKC